MLSFAKRANVIKRHEKFDLFGRSERGQAILGGWGYAPENLDEGKELLAGYESLVGQYADAAKKMEALASLRDASYVPAERGMDRLRSVMEICYRNNPPLLKQFGLEVRYRNITITPPPDDSTSGVETPDGAETGTGEGEGSSGGENPQPEKNEDSDGGQIVVPNVESPQPENQIVTVRRVARIRERMAQRLVEWPQFIVRVSEMSQSEFEPLLIKGWDAASLEELSQRIETFRTSYQKWEVHFEETPFLNKSREQAWDSFYEWFQDAVNITRKSIDDLRSGDGDKLKKSFGIYGDLTRLR